MATHVFLHIGAPKTGTTYLQSILWHNREALRDDGFLYPGRHPLSHTHAVLDLQHRPGFAEHDDPDVPGAWRRLVDEVTAWDGTVIVSQELFSPVRAEHVDHALESLGPAEIHLVYTARDLVRQVPAAWQEDLKNRHAMRFAEFVADLRARPEEMHPLGQGFWRMQHAGDVLARWARNIPPERVHLITIPQRHDPHVLWTRFCQVTGLNPDRYDTSAATVNRSLDVGGANLLRRLNLALGDGLGWPHYNELVTGLIGIDVLTARPGPGKIVLSGPGREWIAGKAAAMVDELRAAGYDVAGDLSELVPAPESAQAADPDDASDAEMLEGALGCMVALLSQLQGRREEIDRLEGERAALAVRLGDVQADRDRLHAEAGEMRAVLAKPATKLFVRRLSEKHRLAMRARIIYWNIVEWLRRRSHPRSKVSAQRSGDTSPESAAR